MNKTIRFTAVTAACALCAFLSVKEVKADELLITSYRELSTPISDLIKSEEILTSDEPLIIGDVLVEDDFQISGDDILLTNDIGNNKGFQSYDNCNDEIILADDYNVPSNDDNAILADDSEKTYNKKTDNSILNTEIVLDYINTDAGPALDTSKATTVVDPVKPKTGTDNKTSTDVRQIMLNEINKKRAKAGVCTLTLNNNLNKVAQKRVNEVTKRFAHTRVDGRYWVTILSENGIDYDYAGENLARCFSNPEQVVNSWSCSPSHNRCMLNSDYTQAGIGTVTVNGCTYWTLTLTD